MSTAEAIPAVTRDFSKFSAGIEAYKQTSHSYKSRKRAAEAARSRLKVAEFNNTDTEFENSFASIAFTYLKERAPSLVENLVGFQLLDKSEENQKACGVFVCQVGQRLIDIPMFFINGEVKGYQVMRIRAPEIFLPLREGFLDYIISQMTNDIGEVGPPPYEQNALRSTPNMDVFAGQRYFKGAGERDEHLDDWAQDLKVADEYRAMRSDPKTLQHGISLLDKTAHYVDLSELLSEYEPLLKTAGELAEDYPHFDRFMKRVCGDQWRELGSGHEKTAADALQPPTIRKRAELQLGVKQAAEQPTEEGSLKIIHKRDLAQFTKQANDLGLDTEQFVKEADMYSDMAFDNRNRSELAEPYVMGEQHTSYAPDGIEICQVLLPDGFKEILVVPARFNQSKPTHDILYDYNRKKWTMAPPSSYVAKRQEGFPLDKEQKAVAKVTSGVSRKPKVKDIFFVKVNDNQFYGPFLCREKLGPREFSVEDLSREFTVTSDIVNRSHGGSYAMPAVDSREHEVSKLIFSRSGAPAGINEVGYTGHLSVPDGSRIVPVKAITPRKGDLGYPKGTPVNFYDVDYDARHSFELIPTDQSTFLRDMIYGRTNLKIAAFNDTTISINHNKLSLGAARRALMVQFELSKEAAEKLITEATRKTQEYIVCHPSELGDKSAKLAFYSPTFDEPTDRPVYPSRSGRFGVQESEIQSLEANNENPEREYLEPWEDPADEDSAAYNTNEELDAIIANDKGNIMDDMAGFISILRNTRIDTSMRKLTKALLNTIDQLGRQIFIFYAHQDEYKEMFGDNEVADIESSLITVFESAGDLFISLVRRSDDPTPELDIVDLPVS